jgi:hypothetical protein
MSTLLEDQLDKIESLSDDGTGLDLSHLLAEPPSFEGLLGVLDWIVDSILASR